MRNRILLRSISTAAIMLVGLQACSSSYDPNLTPQENQIRQRADQFNTTLAEGALAGAVIGALVGSLASSHDRGRNAGIGAAGGAALGLGAGYLVASNTEAQQQTEYQYNNAIAKAQETARKSQEDANTAQQAAAQAQQQLAQLNQQIAQKRISMDTYQRKLDSLRSTNDSLVSLISNYRQHSASMHRYAQARQSVPMAQAAAETDQSIARLQQAESILAAGLGAQPDSDHVGRTIHPSAS